MPDWTYQTVFRPILRQLPYSVAQGIAFGVMGRLGRNPIGRFVVRIMGHAEPSVDVAVEIGGLRFPSPVVLGCGVDLAATAVSTTSLFGFGMIEVGPIVVSDDLADSDATSEWRDSGLEIPFAGRSVSPIELQTTLAGNRYRNGVPVVARLAINTDCCAIQQPLLAIELLSSVVDGFTLAFKTAPQVENFQPLVESIVDAGGLVLVALPSTEVTPDVLRRLPHTISGVIVETRNQAESLRGKLGDDAELQSTISAVNDCGQLLIASGGVQEPAEAMKLLRAGANMVVVDSGLAAAGPGLPKRINLTVEGLHHDYDAAEFEGVPVAHRSWFWAGLLGLALTGGGILAVLIGWSRVLLPYDEEYLGMLREEVCSINSNLIPFMSHDRVTLAGTMLSLGPLYLSLAWFGDRRGMHWARVAVLASCFVGFLSFFSFLGFGYFDPFHAFISAILFQFLTLCLRSSQARPQVVDHDYFNSSAWRRALWGQLLVVVQGIAILCGGVVICSFGVTTVFVAEDLEFMNTTREVLVQANPRLIPLVAHDRATFGGMLMSTGVTVLLIGLWGWQRGRRWLWWTLAGSGSAAYLTTIAIHWYVGYTSLQHLLPAYGGFVVLWFSLLLSKSWMFDQSRLRPFSAMNRNCS